MSLTLISEVVTSSSASVTFSSIPNTYRDLILVVRGRGTKSAVSTTIGLRFNGDSGSNYDYLLAGFRTSAGFGQGLAQTSITMGDISAASAPSDAAAALEAIIFDYKGTTFQKACAIDGPLKEGTSSGTIQTYANSGWWRNTAAITQIDVFPDSGNFVDNSVVSLYGRV